MDGLMSDELVCEAVNRSAENGARSPVMYIRKLLGIWAEEYLATVEELSDYEYLQEKSRSGDVVAASRAWKELSAQRDERRARRKDEYERERLLREAL